MSRDFQVGAVVAYPGGDAAGLEDGVPARYTDWRVLGKGGTAIVYRAYDNSLGCDVAIKILKPEILHSAANREMMLRSVSNEVLISRRLRHQYICAIHDLYNGPQGFGTVMDLIEGGELRDWMNQHLEDRLQTAPQRLDLLWRLAEALAYAHTLIVHRDLKPQNIFLRGGDITKPIIMDFGFSVIGEKTSADTTTAYTPKYMAPEQFETPDKVDRRADLWALGIIAYELFAGHVPPHSLKDIIRTGRVPRIPLDSVPPPSNFNAAVRPALDRLILQLTAYEPERRIQAAEDLAVALRRPEAMLYAPEELEGDVGFSIRSLRAVEIPGGSYYLGGRAGHKATKDNEKPQRKITLTPFRIDPCLVTNKEYLEFADSTGRAPPPLREHRVFGAPSHPVVGVTWEEALEFARWAGGSLPTEAQWECAARGGVQFAEYPWGDAPPDPTRANIAGVAAGTTPAGAFPQGASGYGVLDVCGNVWEWCQDAYDEKFYSGITKDSLNPVNNPAKPDPSRARTLRGGSFESSVVQGRCAFRSSARGDERRNDIGFRVVYRND